MQVTSSIGGPGSAPRAAAGSAVVAAIDVEWSKNYRVADGNRAFCYSIVWISVPVRLAPARVDADLHFDYTSVYLDDDIERAELIDMAASDFAAAFAYADFVTGHQLCSDLGVLTANAAPKAPAALVAAREAWRERRRHVDVGSRVIDTRFDAGHLLAGKSRRLVDVCGELNLDVTQPELARKSMTALHRDWLARRDVECRERVGVLNLRHSLSTALVAAQACGLGTWTAAVNVNSMLANELAGSFAWLEHPTFRALLPGDST